MAQPELEAAIKTRPLPRHVGIIMDGNGRWAELKGLPRIEGHREGAQAVRDVTRCARRVGVPALTLFAFSAQNWARPVEEVGGLMELLHTFLIDERDEILTNSIRLNAIGDLSRLPLFVAEPLQALRDESRANEGMVLTLALSYGGREEILHAAKALVKKGGDAEALTEADFAAQLWTHGLPEVDLVIRTSGERRVSNFLLWQAAYAEYVFTETLWPDFRAPQLLECLDQFQLRERRFGLTSAQLLRTAT